MAGGEALNSSGAPVLLILPSSAFLSCRELLGVGVHHPGPSSWEGMAPVGDAGVTETKGVALPEIPD